MKNIFFFISVLLAILFLNPAVYSQENNPVLQDSPDTVSWQEKGIVHRLWVAPLEIAVLKNAFGFRKNRADTPFSQNRNVIQESSRIVHLGLTKEEKGKRSRRGSGNLKGLINEEGLSPVFYSSPERLTGTRMILTGQLIVRFLAEVGDEEIREVENSHDLIRIKTFPMAPNTFLYSAWTPTDSLWAANELDLLDITVYAHPDWLKQRAKRAYTPPNDPLFRDQWHLNNTGQSGGTPGEDINVGPAWDLGFIGSADEIIAIVDDGLEMGHEDLNANIRADLSWDFVDQDDNPEPQESSDNHGTSCAGLAAGVGSNGVGISGSAPFSGLVGLRILGGGGAALLADEASALNHSMDEIDIYSNSWGPIDGGAFLGGPSSLVADALSTGATTGRGGLGVIYVWAAGNGYYDDNSNYDGYANSRFTIAVASSTHQGVQASYSEKGANLLITAPSSGGTANIITTDLSGTRGIDSGIYTPDGNYTDRFSGTSASAPMVAGVVALMLQANPSLTWRDVQHILMETADKNDPADPDWITNGAGYWVNHKYGFGRVNAGAAVQVAQGWTIATAELSDTISSSPDIPIPDNDNTGTTSSVTLTESLFIESVEVIFSAADHSKWGDLEIVLTSPTGTRSILSEKHKNGRGTGYNAWTFSSLRHYMESSKGTWTLSVKDRAAGNTGTFQFWQLTVYGHYGQENPASPAQGGGGGGGCFIGSLL